MITRIISFLLILMCTMNSVTAQQTKPGEVLYIGTFSDPGTDGIYVYGFDRQSGQVELIQSVGGMVSPSYLTVHPRGGFVYSVNRSGVIPGKNWGSVSAFAVDPATGKLNHLGDQPAFGAEPCHISTDSKGRLAFVSNYTTGNIVVYPVLGDGKLGTVSDAHQHTGSSVNENRQKGPHVHCSIVSPDDRFLYVVDLGIDKVKVYEIDYTGKKLIPRPESDGLVKPGSGPRHIAFHPDGDFAYVIEELASGITAYRVNKSTGALVKIQHMATTPPEYNETNYCADIHVDGSGQFLYGSNRGHDSLAIYRIDRESGQLELVGFEPTLGEWPRNFLIDPEREYLFAANQNSDNVVIFRMDPDTGQLTPTGTEVSIPKPVCVKIMSDF